MKFIRVRTRQGTRFAVQDERGVAFFGDGAPQDYLALWQEAETQQLSVIDFARRLTNGLPRSAPGDDLEIPYRPPEVWGAAFTYAIQRPTGVISQAIPTEPAGRPVIFFKATPHRCVGPGQPIGARRDARLMIPEPELAVIIGRNGRVIGYLGANDVSSRDLPRENPFYMDASKVFARCCALGPAVVPPDALDPTRLRIAFRVLRGGAIVFAGEGTTERMNRTIDDLVRWTAQHADLPEGTVLCTGSAASPPAETHLVEGDVVEVEVEGIGVLRNPVVVV